MHVHLPKPLHGWREFFGEVGIIVLGVLIALGAEQFVEAIRDHRFADETRESVEAEIDDNLTGLQLRMTAEPCMARRLDELHALVDEWGRTGTFKTPLWVAQAPRLDITLPHYDAAASSGHLALLSREDQYRIGAIVGDLRAFDKRQEAETEVWATLRMLQSGADALSANDRAVIREALQRAANLDYGVRLQQHQILPRAEGWGFKPDLHRFNQYAKRIWKTGRYTPAICAPIDMPAAQANALTGQVTPLPF